MRGVPFEVIGVLEPKGVLGRRLDQDGNVFIPIAHRPAPGVQLDLAQRRLRERVRTAGACARPETAIARAARASVIALAPGAPDDFEVQDQVAALALQRRRPPRSLTPHDRRPGGASRCWSAGRGSWR